MKVIVDQETCTGCELCVQTCPEALKMEGDKAVGYADPIPAESEDSAKQAADDCPVGAIQIQE